MARLRPVTDTPRRGVRYLRQSMANEETISDVIQRTATDDHAARSGIEWVSIDDPEWPSLVDGEIWEQHTGRIWHRRKGVLRIMELLETGQVDVIVLWKWNRLSRKRLHWVTAEERVNQLGGAIESATEPVDTTTASGRFGRNVLVDLAELQSDLIGETWTDTHRIRRQRGLPATGGRRYGYTWHRGSDEHYEISAEQSEVLAWMYETYIAGAGRRELVAGLRARGATNAFGRPWSLHNVIEVLDSGFAAGLLARNVWRNHRVWVPPFPERNWDQGAHEPIIDAETWEQYRAARLDRPARPARVTTPSHPFTGLLLCGHAEHGDRRVTMIRKTHSGPNLKKPKAPSYMCGAWNRGVEGATCVTVAEPRVHAAIMGWLKDHVADTERAATATIQAKAKRRQARTDVASTEGTIADIERQLVRLTRDKLSKVVPESTYLKVRDELLGERAEAEQRLHAARLASAGRKAPVEDIRNLLEHWDVLPVATRRRMLAALMTITIYPAPERHARARIAITPTWEQ